MAPSIDSPALEYGSTTKDVEIAPSCHEAEETFINPAVVKKFKRKADFILLPLLTIAYLLKCEHIHAA